MSKRPPRVVADGGRVTVTGEGVPSVTLVDARPGKPDPKTSLEKLAARSGGSYTAILAKAEEWGASFRGELNGLAGGEAPPSVMALASLATETLAAHKAAMFLASAQMGKVDEAAVDEEIHSYVQRFENGARTSAGLAVVAKDLIVTARREAEASRSAADVPALTIFERKEAHEV